MQRQIVLGGRTVNYELERKKVKNINLRVRPDGSIYVSASRLVPISQIEGFIRLNEKKILAALDNAAKQPTPVGGHRYEEGEVFPYFGSWIPLKLRTGSRSSTVLKDGALIVTVRDCADKELIKKSLNSFYRRECEKAVTDSCIRIYPAFSPRGIAWPEIKFRLMKSKWGSCRPARQELTFNTALAYTPMECVDYVVVHEFCHFLQANHSKLFYAELERVMPDWKRRKKRLNDFSAELG